MTAASWWCLCLDVNGPEVGDFWTRAIGGSHRPGKQAGDPGAIVGPGDRLEIELCAVPEPKQAKHRVHLDVHTGSIEELTDLGATVLLPAEESGFGWTVMADPEGGEFCAFVRDQPPAYRLYEVIVDAADPEAITAWWAERFGVEVRRDDDDPDPFLAGVPGMPFECLFFQPVPEPKTVKNRIHWDVHGDVGEFERAGATVLWEMPRWTAMADPEGNEFCVFPPTH